MAVYSLGITKKTNQMVTEFTSGPTVKCMTDSGRMAYSTVKESRRCPMEQCMTDSGIWVFLEVLESVNIPTVVPTKESGLKVSHRGMDSKF